MIADVDPQGGATTGCGIAAPAGAHLYQVFLGQCGARSVIQPAWRGLDVLPTCVDLAAVEVEITTRNRREWLLRDALKEVMHDYDVVILDTPATLGLLFINALACATCILVPVQCEYYGLQGVVQMHNTVERVKSGLGIRPAMRILLTMYDGRLRLARETASHIREHFGAVLCQTRISRSVVLAEAPSHGLPIIAFAKASRGAAEYTALADELLPISDSTTKIPDE